MTKVPLPYVPVRACLSATYASPNFRAFLTCRAPENWKSRPGAATGTPTNPRSRCTTKSTTIQALSSLLVASLSGLLVGNATRLFACRVGAHDEISRVCQLHGEFNLPQLADCAVSDMISITHAGFWASPRRPCSDASPIRAPPSTNTSMSSSCRTIAWQT